MVQRRRWPLTEKLRIGGVAFAGHERLIHGQKARKLMNKGGKKAVVVEMSFSFLLCIFLCS
jgi:hypothetical protein